MGKIYFAAIVAAVLVCYQVCPTSEIVKDDSKSALHQVKPSVQPNDGPMFQAAYQPEDENVTESERDKQPVRVRSVSRKGGILVQNKDKKHVTPRAAFKVVRDIIVATIKRLHFDSYFGCVRST